MINLNWLKNKICEKEIVWDKIRMYGEEERQFNYWIMEAISTEDEILAFHGASTSSSNIL